MRNTLGEVLFGAVFSLECGHRDDQWNVGPWRMAADRKRDVGTPRECPSCTCDESARLSARSRYRVRRPVMSLVTGVQLDPSE